MEIPQGLACGRVVNRQDCTPDGFRWLSLQRLKYEDNFGRCFDWEAVARQPRTGAAMKSNCDGVAVFAKVVSRSGPQRVPVVVQFRPPLDGLVIELPAGLVEPGQTVEETALRELREETGYLGQVMYITSPLSECAGLTDSCCKLAVVEVDGDAAESIGARSSPEVGELLQCELLPYDNLLESLLQLRDRCGAANGGSETSCIIDSRLFALALGLQMSIPNVHGGVASSSSRPAGEVALGEGTVATEAVYCTPGVQGTDMYRCATTDARNGNTGGTSTMYLASTSCPGSRIDVAAGSRCSTFHNSRGMVPEGGASKQLLPSPAGGPMEWLDSFLEQLPGLSEGEVQAILTDRDPDDLDIAALAPLHSRQQGLKEDGVRQQVIEDRLNTATGSSSELCFTQVGSSGHQLEQRSEGDRECTVEHRRHGGRRRRGGRRQQSDCRSAAGQQSNPGPADLPVSRSVKRRGRSTVGGGGPKGFAATNAKPLYRRHGHQKGRQCASFGLVAAMRATRNLLNARGWVSWAASDPVATACTVVVCSVALSAGVLTFRAWLHRSA